MYTSEKTDRVVWQVTDTTGVPILGRVQAKLMNYISYPEIHAPQERSPVSQDSFKSRDYVHSLKTTNHSLQSTKMAQSMDSLKTTPKTDQTAQEEHRAATKAKPSTAHEPKSAQVSWCKSSVTLVCRCLQRCWNSTRWTIPHTVKRLTNQSSIHPGQYH